jgi:hypothetical protein
LHVGKTNHGAGVEMDGKFTVKRVVGEVDIGQPRSGASAAGSAVGTGIGAEVGDFVAAGKDLAVFGLADIDAGDAQFV